MSHADARSTEPCEGSTSPSNPTKGASTNQRSEFDTFVNFRCSSAEKQALINKAKRAGVPFAQLMREALGLAESRRRKPLPCVDPDLIRAVSRFGSNVNQIARWLNAATASGRMDEIDAVTIAIHLVAIDRSLSGLINSIASEPPNVEKR